MTANTLVKSISIITLLTMSSLSTAQGVASNTTIDGLQLIDDTKLALVYAQPGIDLGQYNRIYLEDAYIAFKKNWQRDQNRSHPNTINSDDILRMKSELSELFSDVFSKTLEEGGYELVTEPAADVLLIKPAIINLDVFAPDTMSANRTYSYAESAGEMTLYMELYDSVTGDLIAKALDRKLDRRTGFFQWQTQISNRAAANRILQVWANVLKEGLDDARGKNQQHPLDSEN